LLYIKNLNSFKAVQVSKLLKSCLFTQIHAPLFVQLAEIGVA
jgi:hypothetical protein